MAKPITALAVGAGEYRCVLPMPAHYADLIL